MTNSAINPCLPLEELCNGINAKGRLAALKGVYTINSEDKLNELYSQVLERRETPKVDFSKETVVAYFTGQMPNDSYRASITAVFIDGNSVPEMQQSKSIIVNAENERNIGISWQGLTRPYAVVKVPGVYTTAKLQEILVERRVVEKFGR